MIFDFLYVLLSKVVFFTGAVLGKNSFERPLSKEEEEKYLARVREGDKEAKDILVRHNMRLVAHIAKKYAGAAENDDLLSVGSIGLIKAISTYEPGHNTTLASYTARCIENEILMLIRSNKKYKGTVSLSDPVGTDKDGNELTLSDLLFEKDDNVFDKVDRSLVQEKFLHIMKEKLSEREYTVLSLRYGLGGGVPLTQREVAGVLRISRSYISRIEKRAIERLRTVIRREDFLD